MRLSGQELKQLHQALVSAYPDRDSLRQMLFFEVERELDVVAPDGPLDSVLLALISRAQRENWLRALVMGAHAGNPMNADLSSFHDWFVGLSVPMSEDQHYDVAYMYDREPLLGRPMLRVHVRTLCRPNTGARIFVVDGDPVSGKTYTLHYISYLKQNLGHFKFAWIDLRALTQKLGGSLEAQDVGESIARQLGLNLLSIPPRETEQAARWSLFYCDWFTGAVQGRTDVAWIIVDECRSYLRQQVRTLIDELAQRIAMQLEGVRLVLLDQKRTDLPPNLATKIEEERIQAIDEDDLVEFFRCIHSRIRSGAEDDEFEDRIAHSVASVLRSVDLGGERRLEQMSVAAREEAAFILKPVLVP